MKECENGLLFTDDMSTVRSIYSEYKFLNHNVILPRSTNTIDNCAFANSRIETIFIHDNIHTIGSGAFANSYLSSITFSATNRVRKIGDNAFKSCSRLRSIDIPKGVSSIEDDTFYYCTELRNVVIPNGVRRIGNNALQLQNAGYFVIRCKRATNRI